MSSAKRRLKRKAAILARMDSTVHFCQTRRGLDSWDRKDGAFWRQEKAARVITCMQALGRGRYFANLKSRQHVGAKAINALRSAQNREAIK